MTDVSLEVLNRRTAVAAVHDAAARIGADADALLDSAEFYGRVTSMDPDSLGYRKQVRDMVAAAAGQAPAPAQAAPARPAAPAGPRQWTMEDVDRSTAGELAKAMNEGLLRDLGCAPPRRRGQRA
jgi:hypothetical protein